MTSFHKENRFKNKNVNRFDYKKREFLIGPHLLGTLLLMAGTFSLLSPFLFKNDEALINALILGFGSIVLGLMIYATYEGIFVDFDQNRFRVYFSISGYKIGEWYNLPKIQTVKLISKCGFKKNTSNGISPTFTSKVNTFKLLMYSSNSMPVISLVYSKKKQALMAGKYLASISKAEFVEISPE